MGEYACFLFSPASERLFPKPGIADVSHVTVHLTGGFPTASDFDCPIEYVSDLYSCF